MTSGPERGAGRLRLSWCIQVGLNTLLFYRLVLLLFALRNTRWQFTNAGQQCKLCAYTTGHPACWAGRSHSKREWRRQNLQGTVLISTSVPDSCETGMVSPSTLGSTTMGTSPTLATTARSHQDRSSSTESVYLGLHHEGHVTHIGYKPAVPPIQGGNTSLC
jgi:hypothetical protein